jgi:hypothetical protein
MTNNGNCTLDKGDDLPPYGKQGKGAPYRQDEASKDGARKVNRDGSRMTQCAFVLAAIKAAGPEGIDAYRIYNMPGATFRDLSTCRARISDLLKQGKIAKKGERVAGEAGVRVNLWVAAEYAPAPEPEPDEPDLLDGLAPRAVLSIRKPMHLGALVARFAGA